MPGGPARGPGAPGLTGGPGWWGAYCWPASRSVSSGLMSVPCPRGSKTHARSGTACGSSPSSVAALEERLARDRDRLRRLRVEETRLARWDEERFLLPELLRALSAAVPDGVVLEAVRRDGAELRVTGRARSAPGVARTLEALLEADRMGGLELLWVEQAGEAADSAEQRFAFGGSLRYASREPEPFQRVEAVPRTGERSR